MTETPNLHLKKADLTEPADIRIYNEDMDLLDAACATLQDGLETANTELLNKANITEVCRPNLFINGDFSIWQRGTSFDAPGYTADGWINATQKQSTVRVEKISTGLKAVILGMGGGGSNIGQVIEFPERYAGKTLTLAIDCYTTGSYRAIYIGYAPEGQETVYKVAAIQQNQRKKAVLTVEIPLGITRLECGIGLIHPLSQSDAGTYTEMYTAKLEVGERFTGFYPSDPATELARCQRYYEITSLVGRTSSVPVRGIIGNAFYKVQKRVTPAITIISFSGAINCMGIQNRPDLDVSILAVGDEFRCNIDYNETTASTYEGNLGCVITADASL